MAAFMVLFMVLSALAENQIHLEANKGSLEDLQQKTQLFYAALAVCEPKELDVAGPLIIKNRLVSTVHGREKNGKCRFSQTLPHGEIKTCHLDKKQLEEVRAEGSAAVQRFLADPKICPSTPAPAARKEPESKVEVSIGSPVPRKKEFVKEYEALVALRDKINTRKVSLRCDKTADCRNQNFGYKSCGGPIGSFIYSLKTPGHKALSDEVNKLSMLDASLQKKLNVSSNCLYYEAPQLECRQGTCQVK